MTDLSIHPTECNWDRYNALWAEVHMRQKVIRRIYPSASFRSTHGGFFWDRTQGSVMLVILNVTNDSHDVHYDEELTLLMRSIDAEMEKQEGMRAAREALRQDPDLSPIRMANRTMDVLVMAACDDETWARDDVQDVYAKMMGHAPLDRMVEALSEDDG